MKPVEPTGLPGQRIVLAENQDQYKNLVAHMDGERVYTRWSLDETERRAILDGACVELITWTFGRRFQPVYLCVQGVEERSEVGVPQPTPEDGRINVRGAITSALVTTTSETGLHAGAVADRLTDEILRELRGKRRMVLLWLSGDDSEETE